jgi:thiol-disulfide isomerase/thioredoxin
MIFGIKIWVWISIFCILGLSVYLILNKKENFKEMASKKPTIYNFNTKTCGWSKKFQPEWDKFSEIAKSSLPNIIVKDIKCEENKELCSKYNIPGYPYVLLEIDDKIIPYNGKRTVESLTDFCNKNMR